MTTFERVRTLADLETLDQAEMQLVREVVAAGRVFA